MAKIDDLPKEFIDKLSDKELKQITKLLDGGIGLSEALDTVGKSVEQLTKGMDDKAASAINSIFNVGSGAATGGVAGAALAAVGEGAKIISGGKENKKKEDEDTRYSARSEEENDDDDDDDDDDDEDKPDKTLQKVGAGLGAAQAAMGLIKGQSTDIPEFAEHEGTKRAADMLAEAYEQGIDPNILAEGKKDIEMRRRSMLYQSEGASTSGGERFNRDVAANLMSNKAGKELAISADREKYAKLGPAANALLQKDEMAFRKDMARREGAYREAEAAGQMVGAGIKNITGSLMLGEQFKSEKERKKYDNV